MSTWPTCTHKCVPLGIVGRSAVGMRRESAGRKGGGEETPGGSIGTQRVGGESSIQSSTVMSSAVGGSD